ncbi:MAG: ATP-binding protein [Streptococcaceae bacterium]|jgi:type IV secretory pathway VirB4 component|nr:ATP-binding protein [Streptococcaceae bacterium]
MTFFLHFTLALYTNRAICNVTDTMIYGNKLGQLHLVAPQGESYVAILPIGKIGAIINGQGFAEKMQNFNFPIELIIKAQFLPINGLLGLKSKMHSARTRSKQILKEAQSSGNVVYDRVIQGKYSLDDLARKIDNKEPIIEYGCFLVVAGKTKEQLRIRRETILNAFQNMQIEVSNARMDTPYLFQSLLQGNQLELTTRFWHHIATSKGLAEHLLFTTAKSGAEKGFYIGRIDGHYGRWENLIQAISASRNIVLYSAMLANKENIKGKITKNLHTLITGETGSGKTMLAMTIFLQETMTKSKVLYIDPKKTIRNQWLKMVKNPKWRNENSQLASHVEKINFVTLDAKDKKNHGVLDPIVILDPADAIETAKSMIEYLGGSKWKMREKTAISKAVKTVVAKRRNFEKVGLKHVIELLRNHEEKEIQDVGEFLFEMLDGSLLSLAFSDGDVKGMSYHERATVLEVADLQLPKKDKQELSERERNSVVLMMALGNFCQRFGEMNAQEETIEFFDEAWVLMNSNEGQRVIKSMRRIGRSQNNKLVLITQSVHDVDTDDDSTGFGDLFVFYEKEEEEAILKQVGLPNNTYNRQWIRNMLSGQCLYLDVYGRLNRISIDILPEWVTLFSPEQSSKQQVTQQIIKEGEYGHI